VDDHKALVVMRVMTRVLALFLRLVDDGRLGGCGLQP
jgi:hypothetical protein